MNGSQTSTAPAPPYSNREAGRAMRWAWVSLCLLPVSFVGAVLKAGVPATLVLVAPTLSAAWFGLKAKKLGHPDWLAPVLAAGVIAAASIALNLLQLSVFLVQ